MILQEKVIAQLNAKIKIVESKVVIGILNKEGTLVEVTELEENEASMKAINKNMKEREKKQFRKRILQLCYLGIKEADHFINLYPGLFLTKPEQVKEDLYRITYYFNNLPSRNDNI